MFERESERERKTDRQTKEQSAWVKQPSEMWCHFPASQLDHMEQRQTTQPAFSWLPTHKSTINTSGYFMPLRFGVVCLIAVGSWDTLFPIATPKPPHSFLTLLSLTLTSSLYAPPVASVFRLHPASDHFSSLPQPSLSLASTFISLSGCCSSLLGASFHLLSAEPPRDAEKPKLDLVRPGRSSAPGPSEGAALLWPLYLWPHFLVPSFAHSGPDALTSLWLLRRPLALHVRLLFAGMLLPRGLRGSHAHLPTIRIQLAPLKPFSCCTHPTPGTSSPCSLLAAPDAFS